jgi:Cu(I)/Ag(I) efflux system membrane fusion protein
MKQWKIMLLVLTVAAGSFLVGDWYSHQSPWQRPAGERKLLYYVDPMNPGNKYDKPGIAPCGMQLEPVYAEGRGASTDAASMTGGVVRISPEKQQLIGVRVEQVEKASSTHLIHQLGRVVADETRVYRINAAIDGWIRKASPVSTGSLVRKNETLATFYAPEFPAAQQAFIYGLSSLRPVQSAGSETKLQIDQTNRTLKQYEDSLRNLGMGDHQIKEMAKTRKYDENIIISSPVSGFLLLRNVSPGQRFEKGTELFRIADLRRVWIQVDTYENEARYFRPGQSVPVRYQGKTFIARVSRVLPQFDPATRTLKVRLEAENPGYMLRPDMFVDVDFQVNMPPGITVPADAVLDSGLKKTVFVDRGNGYFEPRKVETGRYFDDRVEIIKGLMPGERIVVSGNFLIDSESRMKTASSGISGTGSMDPSCGMMVDEGRSRSEGLTSEYQGKKYYFCSTECKTKFDKSPGKFAEKPAKMDKIPGDMKDGGHHHD